nr:MAG TPA: hypothetical protein [Caudoviricetes sp.]
MQVRRKKGCKFDGLWMVNQNSHRARKELKKKRENEKRNLLIALKKLSDGIKRSEERRKRKY